MDSKTKNDLLLYCLGIGTDIIEPPKLENLSTDDWAEIIQHSINHGVSPLLYHRFRITSMSAHVPDGVMQKLERLYIYQAGKNTLLYHELSKVLRILQNNSIPVIVLKGAVLAGLIYQNIALRPMCDVDLLIKSKDIWMLDKALTQLGYKSDLASLLSKQHMHWTQHIKYTNGVIFIEVHPKIYELPDINPWVNAFPTTVASANTLMLSYEVLLLHLCLHVDRHLRVDRHLHKESVIGSKLIWLCDIAEVLRRYQDELDWNYLIEMAKMHNVEVAIYHILHVVNEWFGKYVPANVFSQLKNEGDTISIYNALCFRNNPSEGQGQSNNQDQKLNSFLFSISKVPLVHNKIYHVLRSIFPRVDYMIHHYSVTHPNRVFFYYFIRIGEVTLKAIIALCRLPNYIKSSKRLAKF